MIHKRKIYGFMCDVYGHLNNANYLFIYEEARAEGLEEAGIPIRDLEKIGVAIYLSEINLTFKKPLMLEEIVTIKSNIIEFSKIKSVWRQEMYNSKNELCNVAVVKGVFIKNGKPARIDRELHKKIADFIEKDEQ